MMATFENVGTLVRDLDRALRRNRMEGTIRRLIETGPRIGLAFSGGGFRATLFHLGVVRYLYETHLLRNVRLMTSVSGGSVLAGHLNKRWVDYTGPDGCFDEAVRELLQFIASDLRGRILRRWLLGCAVVVPRIVSRNRWSRSGLLERAYRRFFSEVNILQRGDLPSECRPDLHVLSTECSSRGICDFNHDGITLVKWGDDNTISEEVVCKRNGVMPMSVAVAASSAFPIMFAPFNAIDYLKPADETTSQRLVVTDGGVVDNVGLERLRQLFETNKLHVLLVSDAGAPFEKEFVRGYINGLVRAADVGMYHAARQLWGSVFDMWARFSSYSYDHRKKKASVDSFETIEEMEKLKPNAFTFIGISIQDGPEAGTSADGVPTEVRSRVSKVRTEFDPFTVEEQRVIINQGYHAARKAMELWTKRRRKYFNANIGQFEKMAASIQDSEQQQHFRVEVLDRLRRIEEIFVENPAMKDAGGFEGTPGKWVELGPVGTNALATSHTMRAGLFRPRDWATWAILPIIGCIYMIVGIAKIVASIYQSLRPQTETDQHAGSAQSD
jgi:predicted acylesterase/phospholipase RssA